MKILIINWQDIKNPFAGGAEVHLHEIFKRIAALGHEVSLFSCEFDGCKSFEVIDAIKVFRHGSRSFFNFGVRKFYLKHFAEQNFDIVIDDINKIPFYTPLFIKKPLLAVSHHFFGTSIYRETNFLAGTYVLIAEKLVDFIYKSTPFAVVSDSTLQEFLRRGFDETRFRVIENAIHQDNFPMKVTEKNPYPTITYFGRLKKYKSPDHLLTAFAVIKDVLKNAQLYIIGKGDYRPELEKLAVELNIANSTTFFGFVSEEEKVQLLSKSWLAVNTSLKEGWGITNIEANACATPVLSANVPGLKDSVKEGLSGELYTYGNIEHLAEQIVRIIGRDSTMKQYSAGAVEWAKRFSWDKSAAQMLDLCQHVIDSHIH